MAMGLMQQIRQRLEAGGSVRFEDFPGANKATFQASLNRLKSHKLCGTGRSPLNIVRDPTTKAYRLWTPADGEGKAA